MAGPIYTYQKTFRADLAGLEVIRLSCMENGEERMGVDICPSHGCKTFGLRFRKDWLQPYIPRWSPLLERETFGNNVLFPTPNRVRDGVFTFRGQRVEMKKDGVLQTQHGLAWNSPWKIRKAGADENGASVSAEFAIAPGDENDPAFPWRCSLAMTITLREDTLEYRCRVCNQDERPMPFGIGLHPWFLLPEEPEEVYLRMPSDVHFETTPDLLPTGRLLPTEGEKGFDLHAFRRVRELDLDTVFRLTPGGRETSGALPEEKGRGAQGTVEETARLRYGDRGYDLVISATPEFAMGVVFTAFNRGMQDTGYQAFCVESQTCCTDAINLHERGFSGSGLMILAPGETQEGSVTYRIEEHAAKTE